MRVQAAGIPMTAVPRDAGQGNYIIRDETMLLGLDVGGTHTDAVLIDKKGIAASAKVPTDHDNLLHSINDAFREITRDVRKDAVEGINLSTTLSTNAIVEGKIEDVGLFVSGGPGIDPENYRIGRHYHILEGSIDHRGTEVLPLDPKEIEESTRKFRKAGLKVFSAVTKFSTRNPFQENMIRDGLKGADFVTLGHLLSGQLNFSRRIATSYYNSAVWRLYNEFASAIEKGIGDLGIAGKINILKADGGTMPLTVSRSLPVESILSGPAASVMGIIALCDVAEDSIILDIGGTTTDIAVFASGAPLIERDGIALDSRLTLVRSLKTKSIGIGGDSALVISGKIVSAGPRRLGPSMADGGTVPTLIDAFNYRKITSYKNRNLSDAGITELARRHGLDPDALAGQAIAFAVEKIRGEVEGLLREINEKPVYTVHELLEGKRVVPLKLYLMGGPAKAFASLLSQSFGLETVVPENYPVANAIGAALARTTMDIELFADTQKGRLIIPNLGVAREIPHDYSLENASRDAKEYLMKHLHETGIPGEGIMAEITEASSFNMISGFHSSGKNIRVKCQIKPGIVEGYRDAMRRSS